MATMAPEAPQRTARRSVLEVMEAGTRYRTSDIARLTNRPLRVVEHRLRVLREQGRISYEAKVTRKGIMDLWSRV